MNSMVERIAREAKIHKPRVYRVPSDVPNAFATGRNEKNAVVAVTDGMSILDKDEMEAVIAHEISHIKNKDMLIQTMAATIAGAISYLARRRRTAAPGPPLRSRHPPGHPGADGDLYALGLSPRSTRASQSPGPGSLL